MVDLIGSQLQESRFVLFEMLSPGSNSAQSGRLMNVRWMVGGRVQFLF